VTALRWLVWASLRDKHADLVRTPEDAGRLIDQCGESDRGALMRVMIAFVAMQTEEQKRLVRAGVLQAAKEGVIAGNPPLAQAEAAGHDSTSMLVSSV
jgi:DNA invertase Pin-like site-specific DNA recombinase